MDFIGGTGPIMHMIGLPTFMEVYSIDRTFQALSPDSIDPGRTKPDVPWAWRISDDAGCANQIVARVFIQCAEALDNKTLKRGNVEEIKVALHTCKEDLRNCEKAFLRLAGEHDIIVQTINKAGGIRVENRVVNDLPQIPNLEQDATTFLASGKRALQSIAEVLNEFYGIVISNARFDKGITQLKKLNPSPTSLLVCLDQFTTLINRVLNLRNFQDHTPKKTIVENFHITADELLPPMWRVDPEAGKPMLPEMHDIISSLIALAECSFFHGLVDNVYLPAGPFAYVVEELPPTDRNEGSAIRYRCELKFVQSPSQRSSEEVERPLP